MENTHNTENLHITENTHKKLLFFDIDGTLITDHGVLPESCVKAVHEAQKNGHICLINSGRTFARIPQYVKDVGFDGYVASCGSHILMNGESIYYDGFTKEESREIAEEVRASRIAPVFESEGEIWFDDTLEQPEGALAWRRYYRADGLQCPAWDEDPEFKFDKFCLLMTSDGDLERFVKYIEPRCTVIDRGHGFYEIVKKPNSKESGILYMIDYFKVDVSDCYAFGDSTNDLPMLRCVTHSVAMGQSPEEIKAVCEYITDSPEEDGIEHALRHYGLIE